MSIDTQQEVQPQVQQRELQKAPVIPSAEKKVSKKIPRFAPPEALPKTPRGSKLESVFTAMEGFMTSSALRLRLIRDVTENEDSQNSPEKPPDIDLRIYGNQEVLDHLRGIKPEIDNNPDIAPRKLCIVVLGGGQACITVGGILSGMKESGAYDRADGVVAMSGGIILAMCAETDQIAEAAEVVCNDNTKVGNFINFDSEDKLSIFLALNAMLERGIEAPLIDTTAVTKAMRDRGFDVDRLRESKKDLRAVLTDIDSGEVIFNEIKKAEDPIEVVNAGICPPGMSTIAFGEIDGKRYADGGTTVEVPVEWAFNHGYTDVLVVSNTPFIGVGRVDHAIRGFILENTSGLNYGYSSDFKNLISDNRLGEAENKSKILKILNKDDPNRRIAVIEPYGTVPGFLDMNPGRLRGAYTQAKDFAKQTFS